MVNADDIRNNVDTNMKIVALARKLPVEDPGSSTCDASKAWRDYKLCVESFDAAKKSVVVTMGGSQPYIRLLHRDKRDHPYIIIWDPVLQENIAVFLYYCE